MKKALALMLALVIAMSVSLFAVSGTAEEAVDSCTVYVTIVDKGEFAVPAMPTGVIDIDNDGALTINDALYCAHEAYYDGGAKAGYGSSVTSYGLGLTKLWGDTNNGGFGYYVDNNMCWSLADPVTENCSLVAFLYTDTAYWSDAYTFFDKPIVSTDDEIVELTLNGFSYDANWNLVATPIASAAIDVFFEANDSFVTDENGNVTVPVTEEGYYTLHISKGEAKVPAICYMPASATVTEVEDYTAATCKEAGSATVNGCEYIIPVLPHTETVDEAVEATCTKTGLTEGSHCSVCNEVIEAQEEVKATGHKDENKDGKCDVCGTVVDEALANPCKDAKITVAGESKVNYGKTVVIKAKAENVPDDCTLVMVIGEEEIKGDSKEVTFEGKIDADIEYTVKVVDKDGNVQKNGASKDLSVDGGKITCNKNILTIIIAFFMNLFRINSSVTIEA